MDHSRTDAQGITLEPLNVASRYPVQIDKALLSLSRSFLLTPFLSFSSLSNGGSFEFKRAFCTEVSEDECSLTSKPRRSRPDGSEDQRSKGKAPRERAEERRKKGERDRRPSGYRCGIAGGVLSQFGGHFPRYAVWCTRQGNARFLLLRRALLRRIKNSTATRVSRSRRYSPVKANFYRSVP